MRPARVRGEPDLAVTVQNTRHDLSVYLTQQILRLIQERDLEPGERLPAARALAEHFAVAIPTLREALRRLQATGVVELRHGSGIYVLQRGERLLFSNPGAGLLAMDTVLQLFDARLLIEPHLAGLAASSAGQDEIENLREILHLGEKRLDLHGDGYLQTNKSFHTAIGRMSRNLVLTQIVQLMVELYSTELERVDPTHTLEEVRLRDHRAHLRIADAIEQRRSELAREAMIEHLTIARSAVEDRIAVDASIVSGAS